MKDGRTDAVDDDDAKPLATSERYVPTTDSKGRCDRSIHFRLPMWCVLPTSLDHASPQRRRDLLTIQGSYHSVKFHFI